jgi:pimeloyl-ACP methyl ester carboxylesterase
VGESRIDINGIGIHLRRAGKGVPVLFLHGVQGLPGPIPLLDQLAESFDVVAPDHPGFGGSDRSDQVIDVADLGFFYLDLLGALDLSGVHVVGASLGGWVAMAMAVRSTARIKSLALIDAAGIHVAGVARGDMFIASATELGRLLFASEDAATAWAARWQEAPALLETYDKNRHAAAQYTWQPRLYDPRLARWLHRIDVPTQILWGEEDRLIPKSHGEALRRLIPGAALSVLPDCGHMAEIERPDLVAREIKRFIERLER